MINTLRRKSKMATEKAEELIEESEEYDEIN